MKKIFITLFCVFIGCSMFAQTTIFTQETKKLISVSDETLREDKDGIIYQERKCVDGDGKGCIATFMYYPENHIFLIIEFNDISVCYAVRPD